MDMIGIRRPRGRDLATGIVRGAGLGLAALFLFWDTTHTSTTGAAVTVLFGSMFTLSPAVVPLVIACARRRPGHHRGPGTGRCCSAP